MQRQFTTLLVAAVLVAADSDGTANETNGTSAGAAPFGRWVSSFVASLENETDDPRGRLVASFVTAANPGTPPAHVDPATNVTTDDANESDRRGPPAHAGPTHDAEGDRRGPPSHAGPTHRASDDGDDGDDRRRGPPAHAGGHGRN